MAIGTRLNCPVHGEYFIPLSNPASTCPTCLTQAALYRQIEMDGLEGIRPENHALGDCLDEAKRTICGERQDVYGSPEDSFALIADYWSTYLKNRVTDLDAPLSAKDIAHMMILFKMARVQGQKPSRDNYVDLCGYAGIAADKLMGGQDLPKLEPTYRTEVIKADIGRWYAWDVDPEYVAKCEHPETWNIDEPPYFQKCLVCTARKREATRKEIIDTCNKAAVEEAREIQRRNK